MELFRVTKEIYQNDLSGQGAFLNGGRWNGVGFAALYLASHRSLAILETLVHLRVPRPPQDYLISIVYVPDTLAIQNISLDNLSKNWKRDTTETQKIGDKWLTSNQTPLLRVPSVIVNAEYNFILNPIHPDFQHIKLINTESLAFDERFFRKI